MPYAPAHQSGNNKNMKKAFGHAKHMGQYLVCRPSILVECPVIVQDIDKRKLVSKANFIIVGVVRRSNLDGTGPELHVDGNGICDDG